MSYNEELQSNNIDLQGILDTVNALPDAGGSGGGSVETCNVAFRMAGVTASVGDVYYTGLSDGVPEVQYGSIAPSQSITCVKGTLLTIRDASLDADELYVPGICGDGVQLAKYIGPNDSMDGSSMYEFHANGDGWIDITNPEA